MIASSKASKMARAPSPYELHPKSRNKLDQVLEELRIAEHNCDIILQKAEDMIRLSLLFHDLRNPAAMIDPLRDLVRMLKECVCQIKFTPHSMQ